MGSDRFEFEGKERGIFIDALRAYSDNCALPNLTPSCPFFEVTATGPSCGEQCHDLLAAHGSERGSGSALNLGFGLLAYERRPRRSRRGPEPSSRPYDAQRLYLRDRDRPTDSRHTASLLTELETQLRTPPWFADDLEERRYLIGAAFAELVRRGFSSEDLLTSLSRRLASRMVAFLAALAAQEVAPKRGQGSPLDVGEEWQAARSLLQPDPDATEDVKILVSAIVNARGLVDKVARWASSLSLEELIAWPAFSKDVLEREYPHPAGSLEHGEWIFDRFTETYPSDWRTSSLHLEWQYIHSHRMGCAPPDEMDLRRMDAAALSREIADRAVIASRGLDSAQRQSVKPTEFTPIAADYLKSGRYEAAAALFEALALLSPDNNIVANNLGFCLIPIDRDRALEVLTRAATMAGKPEAVTYANRVFVLYLLGRTDEALAVAEESRECDPDPNAWLWQLGEDDTLLLGEGLNTRDYIDSLVARIKSDETPEEA